jgi:hypothetical protein
MEKMLSSFMSIGVLIGCFFIFYLIYRSKSTGKDLVGNVVSKRFLYLEVILLIMAIIEGFNAATYAVKEGRDFGASIAMHVLGGLFSGVCAFGISKQIVELAVALKEQKHPLVIVKELGDAILATGLAILFPCINSFFIAIITDHHQDFWYSLNLSNWAKVENASVYYSTLLGAGHILGCFYITWASFDVDLLETKMKVELAEVETIPVNEPGK